ncbi:hypothetical protein [Brucella pituitosa]
MPKLITTTLKAAICLLAFAEKLITSVLNAILRLFGMQMPATSRKLPTLSTRPSDVMAEIQDHASGIGTGYPKLLKPTSDAGHILYRFAIARSAEARAAMDLSVLTQEQQDWLLLLSDADLERLAKVGLDGCTRAMSGKRCGIGGLPAMHNEKSAETSQPQPTAPLARRIVAHKLASFA